MRIVMIITIIVAHFLSLSLLFAATWAAAYQAPLSSTISQIFFEFISNRSVTLSNNPILCHPLLLLPSIFSSIRVFSNYLVLSIKQPKYWSFSFSIHPSNEYSGLTFLRIDWFDLAVQGTLKSLSQHRVWKHQFFSAQSFLWSTSHVPTWLLGKSQPWLYGALLAK